MSLKDQFAEQLKSQTDVWQSQIKDYQEHSPESFDMILEAADSLSENHLRPILVEMDRNPPRFENGQIIVHPKMRGTDWVQNFMTSDSCERCQAEFE